MPGFFTQHDYFIRFGKFSAASPPVPPSALLWDSDHIYVRSHEVVLCPLMLCMFFPVSFLSVSVWKVCFFFFFFFLLHPRRLEVPRSELNLSCSCGNARSLTHCVRPTMGPHTQRQCQVLNPLRHNRNSGFFFFFFFKPNLCHLPPSPQLLEHE